MIKASITQQSANSLYLEIQNKIDGAKELQTVYTKDQLANAAFSIASLKFIKRTHLLARSAKKSFHHVYEWGQIGTEEGRLFRLFKQTHSGGYASVYYKFNNSRKKSPIADALRVPGKTGKSVTRSGVFKRKAEVMENGQPVSFVTKRTIAIAPRGEILFIPEGKTVSIKNPGGRETTGSFEKHFRVWWETMVQNVLDESGVAMSLEKSVARALSRKGAGRAAAKDAIYSTLKRYTTVKGVI